ncbi:hypothetical protein NMG60_11030955 [Bertholletia excelsa]
MEYPFFANPWPWSQTSSGPFSPIAIGMPVEPVQGSRTASPNVVSIPVQFVSPETSRASAALKIQKVFKGFLVRKSMRRIASVKREVEEVERRVSKVEFVELIQRNEMEKLRVNEALMSLLFKLDSVRGVDSGVRDCRKAVIRKAIALQERIDAIASGNQIETLEINHMAMSESDPEVEILETEGKSSGGKDSEVLRLMKTDNSIDSAKDEPDVEKNWKCSSEADESRMELHRPYSDDHETELEDREANGSVEIASPVDIPEVEREPKENADFTEIGTDSGAEEEVEIFVEKVINEDEDITRGKSECFEESGVPSAAECSVNPKSAVEQGDQKNTSEKQREGNSINDVHEEERADCTHNRELLEKMAEDNQKMMSMLTHLVERNEAQTRILNSLIQRVEQLERALICDRLRRMRKKK